MIINSNMETPKIKETWIHMIISYRRRCFICIFLLSDDSITPFSAFESFAFFKRTSFKRREGDLCIVRVIDNNENKHIRCFTSKL